MAKTAAIVAAFPAVVAAFAAAAAAIAAAAILAHDYDAFIAKTANIVTADVICYCSFFGVTAAAATKDYCSTVAAALVAAALLTVTAADADFAVPAVTAVVTDD